MKFFSSTVWVDHRIVSGCVRVRCRHLARAVALGGSSGALYGLDDFAARRPYSRVAGKPLPTDRTLAAIARYNPGAMLTFPGKQSRVEALSSSSFLRLVHRRLPTAALRPCF